MPVQPNFFLNSWFDWNYPSTSRRVQIVNRLLKSLGLWTSLQAPRTTGSMTNIEQRMNLWHFVSQIHAYGVPGDLVELGCNKGQSSCLIRKVMDDMGSNKEFHVYDSFEGLPSVSEGDGNTPFQAGQMATTRTALLNNFQRYGLKVPVIHEGWFADTLPAQLPEQIAFAYLDGDLYDSILVSLVHVYPRLSKGAICVIDDYADPAIWPKAWNQLPGVKKACDEFFAGKPEQVTFIYSGDYSHGFFRKL